MNTGQLQVCESQAGAIWSAPARKDAGLEALVRTTTQAQISRAT